MAITQAQMRMLQRRRTTDIDRLAQQYRKNVQAMTGEYQTAFSDYQGRVAEQMKPFEEQMAKYKAADMPAYEAAKASYQQQLDSYLAQLQDIQQNPNEVVNAPVRTAGRSGRIFTIDGRQYGERNLPQGYFLESVVTGTADRKNRSGQVIGKYDITEEKLFKSKPVPTFTEQAPVAPTAPTAPEIAAFDESKFEQRRGQLQQEFTREVGERKAGRIGAVSQRSRRSMLQGV